MLSVYIGDIYDLVMGLFGTVVFGYVDFLMVQEIYNRIRSTFFEDKKVICPACGTENDSDNQYCKECGALLTDEITCPKCGESNTADAKFCVHCGEKFEINKSIW